MRRRGGARPNGLPDDARQAPSPARARQRRPGQLLGDPAASGGRPSAPQPLGPVPAVLPRAIWAARSTRRCPSGHVGPGPHALPSPEPASPADACGLSRANSPRRSDATQVDSRSHVSGRSGSAAGSTTISRSRIHSIRRPAPAALPTTRCRGCAIAVLTTRITGSSTGHGPAHPRVRQPGAVTRGITTTEHQLTSRRRTPLFHGEKGGSASAQETWERGGRISRGSANTNVSLAVVTGCTVP